MSKTLSKETAKHNS